MDRSCGGLPGLFFKKIQLHPDEDMTGVKRSDVAGPSDESGPKRAKKDEDEDDDTGVVAWQTVGAIGAGEGRIIRGLTKSDGLTKPSAESYDSVEGTSFLVVQGTVWALPDAQKKARVAYPASPETGDEWAQKLAKFQNTRTSEAALRINRYSPVEALPDGSTKLIADVPKSTKGSLIGMTSAYSANVKNMKDEKGNEVVLEVLSLGPKWAHLGLSIGERIKPSELAHKLNEHFQNDTRFIGFLCLRTHLWVEGRRSGLVDPSDRGPVDEDVHSLLFGGRASAPPSQRYDVEETQGEHGQMKRYRLPVSAAAPFGPEQAKRVFDAMLAEGGRASHDDFWNLLAQPSVSFGALKSLMQKVVRFRPGKRVSIPKRDGGTCEVNARVAMLAATLLCLSTKGNGYIPDLHMTVRGATAACKRLGVIAVEDAWLVADGDTPEVDRSPSLRALFGIAMATMRMPDYHISVEVAKEIGTLSTFLVASKSILKWNPDFTRAATRTIKVDKLNLTRSAQLLRILKSFGGDMDMLDTAAALVSDDQRLPVIEMVPDLVHPKAMPLKHLIDQHVYRGVTHQVLALTPRTPVKPPPNTAFGPRYQTLFQTVTGFNPRLVEASGAFDDTQDPIPSVRVAQDLIAREVFASVYPRRERVDEKVHVAYATVDPAILAQAVGPLDVPTIRDEATGDKWSGLMVILGTRSRQEMVVYKPVRDNKPRPEIPERIKELAIASVRTKSATANGGRGYAFKSTILPFHAHASWTPNGWTVTSTKPGTAERVWSWQDLMSIEIPFVVCPWNEGEVWLNDDPETGILVAAEAIQAKPLAVKTLSLEDVEGVERVETPELERCLSELVTRVVAVASQQRFSPGNVLSRLLSMLDGQYVRVSVPVPGLDGGSNEKELKPERGDWIVYRALLRLSSLVPGALQSSSPKKLSFVVNDARALKHVETVLRRLVAERDAAMRTAGPADAAAAPAPEVPNDEWLRRRGKLLRGKINPQTFEPEVDEFDRRKTLDTYQRDLVAQMIDRDASNYRTQGQYLSLEVGLGKTVIGLLYALEYLSTTPNHGIERVIWITKRDIVSTTSRELSAWGQPPVYGYTELKPHQLLTLGMQTPILVLSIELLSGKKTSEPLAEKLIELAKTTLFIIDEVHQYYGLSDRASRLVQAVSASPKFLAMTATPAATTRQLLAREWLKRCTNFPVSTQDDILVAGAMFISGKFDLKIVSTEEEVLVRLSEQSQQAHERAISETGGWNRAARIVRAAIEDKMAEVAVRLAREDRATNPGGGVLVVADNSAEAASVREKMQAMANGEFRVALREKTLNTTQPLDPNVGIIVVTSKDTTGYNLQRLGAIVTGVYAGNAAQRHQLRGRIRRLGQRRRRVKYVTVIGQNSILSLLHTRHQSTDAQGATLEQMAALLVAQRGTNNLAATP